MTPLWQIGFRPFFLLASAFSIMSILIWMFIYVFSWQIQSQQLPPMTWHAHEMIYGYSLAVISGFLLTAVRNWTKRDTLRGLPLLCLSLLWIFGRTLFFFGSTPIWIVALVDCLFSLCLFISICIPIVASKNWRNIGVLAKILFFFLFNVVFYLGMMGVLKNGQYVGVYGGLYLIVALIITIGHRVIPFFTEKGISQTIVLRNRRWIDIISLCLFIVFYISILTNSNSPFIGYLCLLLAVLYGIRLYDWYTPLIWKAPLLWSLHIAYGLIVLGFIFKAAALIVGISSLPAVHAFAYGGIGLSTISMMARVSLGHTGRSIHNPPKHLPLCFVSLIAGTLIRTLFPLFLPTHYILWILSSQLLWVAAFIVFFIIYIPIWLSLRVDGKSD